MKINLAERSFTVEKDSTTFKTLRDAQSQDSPVVWAVGQPEQIERLRADLRRAGYRVAAA